VVWVKLIPSRTAIGFGMMMVPKVQLRGMALRTSIPLTLALALPIDSEFVFGLRRRQEDRRINRLSCITVPLRAGVLL
jgi:hypothetical protein